MFRSDDRILTTHAGSLPRPEDLVALYASGAAQSDLEPRLRSAVQEVVRKQADSGIDIVDDGEYGKATSAAIDFGPWWWYIYQRLEGFESRPRDTALAETTRGSKDRSDFSQFYLEDGGYGSREARRTMADAPARQLVCTGPVRYVGEELLKRNLANFAAGLTDVQITEAFVPAVSPSMLPKLPNEYYKTQEEYLWASAEAMAVEFRAITDAGFVLQIDDPAFVDIYDWWFSLDEDVAGYLKWLEFQVEALNHALAGIPEDRVRFHVCWGSWHGPHSTDMELRRIVHLLLKVKAQAYSVEAGNVRHEHEWKVWRETKLPDGKILIPGVVSHATNVLEHPEVVADRILNYARAVGRENVIAGTDCGLGGRIHPQLAWAKLRALREGADLATRQLWG